MSSPQSIDGQKREAQISRFFADASREKQNNAIRSAQQKHQQSIAPTDGGVSMADALAQKGRPLSRSTFVRKIESLDTNLFCDQSLSSPLHGAVYLRDGVSNLDSPLPRYRGARFIASFPWAQINEFDLVLTREQKYGEDGRTDVKSAGKMPGWRSVLARLIKSRIITPTVAEKTFQISRGRESERWWLQFTA